MFCYDETEHQPTDAERREAAEATKPESRDDKRPLLPYRVPGNGVSQLVGTFARRRR